MIFTPKITIFTREDDVAAAFCWPFSSSDSYEPVAIKGRCRERAI
jgi:hypothetical protein